MEIDKSSRHRKIIGDFGEFVLCNWLSRSGFEIVRVDHTGIDLIAFHRTTGQRIGITVKSRTRAAGTENTSVNIFKERRSKEGVKQRRGEAKKGSGLEISVLM